MIYFMGSEDVDFDVASASAAAALRGAAGSRSSLLMTSTSTIGAVFRDQATRAPVSLTNFWCMSYQTHVSAITRGGDFLSFCTGSSLTLASRRLKLLGTGASGSGAILDLATSIDGTANVVIASGAVADNAASGLLVVNVQDYGAAGRVRVWWRGSLIIDYTGSLSVGGALSLGGVIFLGSAGTAAYNLAEVAVTDFDLRAAALVSLAPNGAGDINEWTSGGYAEVDEITQNDADVAQTDAADKTMRLALGNLPAGTFIVRGVKSVWRAADGVAGIQRLQGGIKTNGADYLNDADLLTAAFANFHRIDEVNPATGTRFTAAEVNALQLAFVSRA